MINNYKIINKTNLINNFNYCKNKFNNICVMIKADAYGHGIKNIVNILKDKVNLFGVANYTEAIKVKKYCNKDVLVVGKSKEYKQMIQNNVIFTIDTIQELNDVISIAKTLNKIARLHIAVNTGMNRLGVNNIEKFKQILNLCKSRYISLEGLFTHCFDADCKNTNFYSQMIDFYKYVKLIKDRNLIIHIGGSYTLKHKIPNFVNMVRVGLYLYGYGDNKLKPILSLSSNIIKINNCEKGSYVGYGNNNRIKKDTTVAIVPIGYADGLARNLSNKNFHVKINNNRCKIIGYICMDMFMVDVSNINCKIGDTVTIDNFKDVSKISKCSIYEVLTNFISFRGKNIVKK